MDPVPIVIDSGSSSIKAGCAVPIDQEYPRPFVLTPGTPGQPACMTYRVLVESDEKIKVHYQSAYVGDQARELRGILSFRDTIKNGQIVNWNSWEQLLHHVYYNALKEAPEEHPVLMTRHPGDSKANLAKMMQISFETFANPAFYSMDSPVLALYPSGHLSGLSLECGDGVTCVMPLKDGYATHHADIRRDFGGEDATDYLNKILTQGPTGLKQRTSNHLLIQELKEKHSYVSLSPPLTATDTSIVWKDPNESSFIGYQLPDGSQIEIPQDDLRACNEFLFNPEIIALERETTKSVPEMVVESIFRCDIDNRTDFFRNIVLSGGVTLTRGFPERLSHEIDRLRLKKGLPAGGAVISDLATKEDSMFRNMPHELLQEIIRYCPKKMRLNVMPERAYAAWIGGVMCCSLPTFPQFWLSKEEYDESGPYAVRRTSCVG